jgi:hypothetical protein
MESKKEKKSLKQIERDKAAEKEKKLEEERKEQEKQEVLEYIEKFPSEEERKQSTDFKTIQNKYKQEYESKMNKCFHEMGETKSTTTANSVTNDFYCSKCNMKYGFEISSPWHDGAMMYYDDSFEEVATKISQEYYNNKRLYDLVKTENNNK